MINLVELIQGIQNHAAAGCSDNDQWRVIVAIAIGGHLLQQFSPTGKTTGAPFNVSQLKDGIVRKVLGFQEE